MKKNSIILLLTCMLTQVTFLQAHGPGCAHSHDFVPGFNKALENPQFGQQLHEALTNHNNQPESTKQAYNKALYDALLQEQQMQYYKELTKNLKIKNLPPPGMFDRMTNAVFQIGGRLFEISMPYILWGCVAYYALQKVPGVGSTFNWFTTTSNPIFDDLNKAYDQCKIDNELLKEQLQQALANQNTTIPEGVGETFDRVHPEVCTPINKFYSWFTGDNCL